MVKISASGLLASYAATAVVMFVIDMIWLGLIAKPWYQAGMGHLMAASPNLMAAALFYAMFPVGLMLFAVMPQAAAPGLLQAALWGAAFGFFTYATYDLTNLAILKEYPVSLTALDMAWGTVVSAVATMAGKSMLDRWLPSI